MSSSMLVRDPAAPPQTPRSPGPASGPWVWAAIAAVTAVGGLLRFWQLGRPHSLVFDETYYVKQGVSMLKYGYERHFATGADGEIDKKFAGGDWNVFTGEPDFVVHPPVGKWMIAFGEHLFGPDSAVGWRFSSAVVGTLSILMVALIARRLFASSLLGVTAGLLFAVDGQAIVHSRTGLLDGFVMFWALAAFGCLLADRDSGRARLAARLARDGEVRWPFGPAIGIRPWRIAAALCLGLCMGTKWSGLYFAAAFGIMIVLWDVGARRAAGIRHWFAGGVLRDGVTGGLVMLPIAVAVYLTSWVGWFRSTDAYDRQWGAEHPSASVVPDALRSLWHYHSQMYEFNVNLETFHPYQANPWSWLVLGRPTAFYYVGQKKGEGTCRISECAEAIYALGNPVIWWGATLAVAVLLFRWALRRDWRAGAVLAGFVGGYLPWFEYQDRTIYGFYSIAFTPWVVLSVVYVLGLMLGPPGADLARRRRGVLAAGTVVVLAVLACWYFLPILNAEQIPKSGWLARMWFKSWI